MEQALSGGVPRPILSADLPEVMEIDAESLARPWSAAMWRQELESPHGTYLVLEESGALIGYVGVKRVADELHLMTIAVRREHRRKGHARTLIEAALAAHPGARSVYLEVRPSNAAARALYGYLGFREAGRRRRYYGDEDALLMVRHL